MNFHIEKFLNLKIKTYFCPNGGSAAYRCSTSAAVFLFEMLTNVTQHVTPKRLILNVVTLLTPVTGFFSHTRTHTYTCVVKLKIHMYERYSVTGVNM